MPNWCYNKLQIGGAISEVDELRTMMKDGFSLEKINPTPKELMNAPAPSRPSKPSEVALPVWYSWRLDNWGTKWDVLHSTMDEEKKVRFNSEADDSAVVGLEFNTAWSPPIIALKTLSERLTRLIFKLHYSDDMMNFKGEATIKGGEVHDVCKDIDLDPKEFENILQIIKDNDK
jgi:hypothetical protein